jgi:hypothetical protein
MEIEFPYRQEKSLHPDYIYRPVAKVVLKGNNNREVIDYFYVDSGADYTLIPYKLGLFLGLRADNQEVCEVQGISGVAGVIFCKIKMKIGDFWFEVQVAWAQIEHVPLLLGRIDVFDQFEVTFQQVQGKVIFKR